jgi:hypothetical protein
MSHHMMLGSRWVFVDPGHSHPVQPYRFCNLQAQAEATKDAQKAGIAHAKDADPTAYRGRKPSFTREQSHDS